VPEDAFAVDPGGVACQDAERRFDFGAAVARVHAQWHRQRPGQQLAQFVAPGGCLPEQGGGAQAIRIVELEQAHSTDPIPDVG
jgi:hypothetical protein